MGGLDLFAWSVRLSRLLVGFRTHFKNHCTFISFISFHFMSKGLKLHFMSLLGCPILLMVCRLGRP